MNSKVWQVCVGSVSRASSSSPSSFCPWIFMPSGGLSLLLPSFPFFSSFSFPLYSTYSVWKYLEIERSVCPPISFVLLHMSQYVTLLLPSSLLSLSLNLSLTHHTAFTLTISVAPSHLSPYHSIHTLSAPPSPSVHLHFPSSIFCDHKYSVRARAQIFLTPPLSSLRAHSHICMGLRMSGFRLGSSSSRAEIPIRKVIEAAKSTDQPIILIEFVHFLFRNPLISVRFKGHDNCHIAIVVSQRSNSRWNSFHTIWNMRCSLRFLANLLYRWDFGVGRRKRAAVNNWKGLHLLLLQEKQFCIAFIRILLSHNNEESSQWF